MQRSVKRIPDITWLKAPSCRGWVLPNLTVPKVTATGHYLSRYEQSTSAMVPNKMSVVLNVSCFARLPGPVLWPKWNHVLRGLRPADLAFSFIWLFPKGRNILTLNLLLISCLPFIGLKTLPNFHVEFALTSQEKQQETCPFTSKPQQMKCLG